MNKTSWNKVSILIVHAITASQTGGQKARMGKKKFGKNTEKSVE